MVVINNAANLTTTTTKYNTEVILSGSTLATSEYLKNGTIAQGTAPSTTQEWIMTLFNGDPTAVTYPTPYFEANSIIKWAGVLPYTTNGINACVTWGGPRIPNATYAYSPVPSPTPNHSPWPTASVPVDPDDPYGSYYRLQGVWDEYLDLEQISELWPNDPVLPAIYEGCKTAPLVAPAAAVHAVTALLDTSTSFVDSSSVPTPTDVGEDTTTSEETPTAPAAATAVATADALIASNERSSIFSKSVSIFFSCRTGNTARATTGLRSLCSCLQVDV